MTFWKLLTYVNWMLIGIWTLLVIWSLFQPNGSTDAAGRGTEPFIKGLCVFVLLSLVGLNLLPHHWNKVIAFMLEMLLLLLVYNLTTD